MPSCITQDESCFQEIHWGRSADARGPQDIFHVSTIPWDEDACQTFDYARDLQETNWRNWSLRQNQGEAEEFANNLTHVEMDVEGFDGEGNRVRVQRVLEVNLKIQANSSSYPATEETTMECKMLGESHFHFHRGM